MPLFQIGDRVRWTAVRNEHTPVVGTVKAAIPDDSGSADFDLYEIDFAFGRVTLPASQLEPVRTVDTSTERKDHLQP